MTGTIRERLEAKYTKTSGCWNWTASKDTSGYGLIWLDGWLQKAHRVAYQLYVGEISDGLCCLHRCDNPACVRPDHLFLGTNADNVRDCMSKGRWTDNSGEKSGRAKLNEVAVKTIRARHAAGESQCSLAREYGVANQNIFRIVHHRTWLK